MTLQEIEKQLDDLKDQVTGTIREIAIKLDRGDDQDSLELIQQYFNMQMVIVTPEEADEIEMYIRVMLGQIALMIINTEGA